MAAESSSAAIILTSSHFGLPLSTTHVATGSILGTGLGTKGAEVRWGVAGRMAVAWMITLPSAARSSAPLCWALAHVIGGLAPQVSLFGLRRAHSCGLSLFMWPRSRKEPVDAANVTAEWDAVAGPRRNHAPEPPVVQEGGP